MRKLSLFLLLVVAALAPRAAQAYPQWQFSSGTSRCNQCHFSPAGGGLITNYGRDAAGEDLSSWQGNGGFLHGAVELPTWLALGFDTRLAYVRQANGSPEGVQTAIFPMQADLYGRLAFLDQFSLAFTVGYRGQARNSPDTLGDNNFLPAGADRFVSREHYLMWRSGALGPYVRAGRFFAPYGLRLAEHTAYVRRDNGFNLLNETYGVSGGFVQNEWELHVTAFVPDLVRSFGTQDKGVAAMFERRLFDTLALGLDTRLGFSDDANRYGGGAFAKIYNSTIRTLLMGQVDVIHVQGDTGGGVNQLVAFVGPTIFPFRGLWVSGYFEHEQTDIRLKRSATEAINGQLNWFPYPHFELVILGRVQSPQQQQSTKTLMMQLHYYL
jgi:hypothetical protein